MMRKIVIVWTLSVLFALNISAQKVGIKETDFGWWQDARFGMFIHWGPVTRYGGDISWTRSKYGIEKYDVLYKGFNPVKFNAKEWVDLAQKAGMKYMVFTAKHHDGFCMWNTKTTDYTIMNTPFKRDVCKELAEAAHAVNMPICWYFSPADWKDADCRNPKTNAIFSKRVLEQLSELLTNYGKISLLWIDYEGSPCPLKPSDIYNLAKKLQPKIIINNRLDVLNTDESHSCIGPNGDYATPEGFVAGYGAIPWETCTNLGHQWSWKPNDTPRPIHEAATTLLRCAGGNGNLLLNVGPDSLGQIPVNFQERMLEMGDWLKLYGKSVYHTNGGPYAPTKEYVCTYNDKTLYLNVLSLKNDTLVLPAFSPRILSATTFNGNALQFIQERSCLKIIVPANQRGAFSTLIIVKTDKLLNKIGLISPFSTTGSQAYNCKASASSSIGQFLHDPSAAFDDNPATYWKPGRKTNAVLDSCYGKLMNYRTKELQSFFVENALMEVDLGKPKMINRIFLSEHVFLNSKIKEFEIQYQKGNEWKTIAKDTVMGDWLQTIPEVVGQKFRIVISKKEGFSGIKEFQLFGSEKTRSNPTKHSLWYRSPAVNWAKEALPIGNGYMGGMIFGGIVKEQIQYNEKTLWTGGPGAWKEYQGGNNDSAAFYLPEIRTRLAVNDYAGAEKMMGEHSLGNPKAFGAYQNFGTIWLDFSKSIKPDSVSDYLRELNLDDGVARVKFNYNGVEYLREYFCSYPDKVMAVRVSANKPNALNFDVYADCAQPNNSILADGKTCTIVTKGHVPDNNMGYESIIKLRNQGGIVQSDSGRLIVKGATSVTILMTAATEYKNVYPTYTGANPHDTVCVVMQKAALKDYETLLKVHQDDYKNLYNRVIIDLNEEVSLLPTNELRKSYQKTKDKAFETLMFQYGRYLLISSSRTGSLPANLQGVWNNSNNPPWTSDYHFDINIEMNYFSSEVTNLTECSVPLVEYIHSLRAPGRVTAEKHHGVINGGWVVHPMNNPFGFTAPGWETYWGWAPFNAAWICQNLWDKYRFTGDKEYLRHTIYPIIKEQAQFWQKWLIKDVNGYLVSSPAVSPEHLPINEGPTSDESMCYELFSDVIEASKLLKIDKQFRSELLAMRSKLLPLKVGSWGQLQEWKYDWDKPDDKHRHVSHLVSVYQGERINPYSNPLIAHAAKISLAARDNIMGDVQAWSLTQRMGLWARLLEPKKSYALFGQLLGNYLTDNLFSLTGGVFQIDANLGVPGMMAELLLQSHLNNIQLLPALPTAWSKGSISGLCARGGFVVDMSWENAQLTETEILSKLGTDCVLRNQLFNGDFTIENCKTQLPVKYKQTVGGISFKTLAGCKFRIVFH